MKSITKILFFSFILLLLKTSVTIGSTSKNSAEVFPDLIPLKSAAPDGLGPLSLPFLHHVPIGYAYVYNAKQPDLFVTGKNRVEGLYLFKWLRNTADSVPVFDSPLRIKTPYTSKGCIFEDIEGKIHGLWIVEGKKMVHTLLDKGKLEFIVQGEINLNGLPANPANMGALPRKDGSVSLAFELTGYTVPGKYTDQNSSTESWRPYDEAGISSAPVRYSYLYGAKLMSLSENTISEVKQLSPSSKEVYFGMMAITGVDFGSSSPINWITGGRLGIFTCYRNDVAVASSATKSYVTDENEIILRHPTINASASTYPDSKNGIPHLMAGGEGGVYFYRFTGKFSTDGNPIYKEPTPVLQINADLYTGTLPTPSVFDWDGDGVSDLIVGNSEGFVLFFKNIGNDEKPAFLPGEKIKAGGRNIHVQAGYSGSVQGMQESRWGYLSPTVVDWTGDGLPDIIMGDITGSYTVFINKGTKGKPQLDVAQPIFCDGMNLHGMWRSRAAVAHMGNKTALMIIDGEDHFHLYWKIDQYNVEDGGKVKLENGSLIKTSADPAGGTGRCKLSFFDYDGDGLLDLVIGTGRRSAIPNMETGYPLPVLGKRTMGTPLFMKNVGTDEKPVFAHPSPFHHTGTGLLQPGGAHESGAVGTSIGGGNWKNLLVGNEVGRLYLIQGAILRPMTIKEAKNYLNKRNPLPGFPHVESSDFE